MTKIARQWPQLHELLHSVGYRVPTSALKKRTDAELRRAERWAETRQKLPEAGPMVSAMGRPRWLDEYECIEAGCCEVDWKDA